MVKASKGLRSKTRKKLSKCARARGLAPITRAQQSFRVGERAAINIDPGVHKGMPHPKFQGVTGIVKGRQGGSYLIAIPNGNKEKLVIAAPEHLRKLK
ncbi:MAG: 50S ribosomal protein L21e [Candidatus Thermoplasmatota archaeon]|nr:50S ribosomal protein L21e [Candidatus Thermoplasmatota archaeon]